VALPAIHVSAGVHEPSAFSELLVDGLPDVAGLRVVDAGAGAGAVTLALLAGGAAEVIALDASPLALADTERNVASHSDPARLRTVCGDFAELSAIEADLVATNPPQRPRAVWSRLPAEEAAEHAVAGEDGLDALRRIVAATRAPRIVAAISAFVMSDPAQLGVPGLRGEVRLERPVPHADAWSPLGDPSAGRARVWDLHR
jgi:methylase of polypeptide subunit release factors